jgi:hypothetical protein
MNLGTTLVSLLLIVIVAAIIRSIVKDKRAGKNVGCGSCTHGLFSKNFSCFFSCLLFVVQPGR